MIPLTQLQLLKLYLLLESFLGKKQTHVLVLPTNLVHTVPNGNFGNFPQRRMIFFFRLQGQLHKEQPHV